MPRPRWLINIVALRVMDDLEYQLATDRGDHRVKNGTLIAFVNPDLTKTDRERLNDLLNSGAFIAAFLPKEDAPERTRGK